MKLSELVAYAKAHKLVIKNDDFEYMLPNDVKLDQDNEEVCIQSLATPGMFIEALDANIKELEEELNDLRCLKQRVINYDS